MGLLRDFIRACFPGFHKGVIENMYTYPKPEIHYLALLRPTFTTFRRSDSGGFGGFRVQPLALRLFGI